MKDRRYSSSGGEPFGMLDAEEPPERYGVDRLTLLARDPYALFVCWEVTPAARRAAGAPGDDDRATLVLRLHARGGPGGGAQIIDERLSGDAGQGYLPAPYPGAQIDAAIGIRASGGGFTALAYAPRLRVPQATVDTGETPVDWMEVPPPHTRGLRLEPPAPALRGPSSEMPGAARHALPAAALEPSLPPADASPTSPSSPPGPDGARRAVQR